MRFTRSEIDGGVKTFRLLPGLVAAQLHQNVVEFGLQPLRFGEQGGVGLRGVAERLARICQPLVGFVRPFEGPGTARWRSAVFCWKVGSRRNLRLEGVETEIHDLEVLRPGEVGDDAVNDLRQGHRVGAREWPADPTARDPRGWLGFLERGRAALGQRRSQVTRWMPLELLPSTRRTTLPSASRTVRKTEGSICSSSARSSS